MLYKPFIVKMKKIWIYKNSKGETMDIKNLQGDNQNIFNKHGTSLVPNTPTQMGK